MRRVITSVGEALLVRLPLLLLILWASLALWIDGPASRPTAAALALGYAAGGLYALFALRPRGRGAIMALLTVLGVALWWSRIEPRNDRDWMEDVARLPEAEFDGDLVTIRNVRNFDYRSETEYTPRWETRTYDLRTIRGLDFYLSYWGPTRIAHTITSWEFDDGRHLAISIETRKEKGEAYSAVLGFFRQYELYYVVADERDLVRLRTNYRGEEVYLYRFRASAEQARALLVDYLEEVNRLSRQPRWYNALTQNCTTTIRYHVQNVTPGNPWNWRILANGYLDQLAYERGTIDTSLPFEELRRRSNVTERARAADAAPDFSARIRDGVPDPYREAQ